MIALIYFLPLAVMFFAYSVIGFTLWRRGVPGYHAHGANSQYLQAKKKVGWLGGWTGRVRARSRSSGLQARPQGGAAEHRSHKSWPEPELVLPGQVDLPLVFS